MNYPMGKYKIVRKYKRKNKFNLRYNKSLTKYRKDNIRKQNLKIVIAIFASITFGMLIELASTTNSMEINGGAVKVSTPRTSPFVEQSSEAVKPKATALLPVMIENNEIENYIVKEAIKHGVNPDKALSVARCENSNLNPSLKNPNPKSTATGIYQWTIGSWKYYSKMFWNDTTDYRKDYKKNIELAMLTMQKYGFKDWKASEGCWIK